MNGRPAGVTGLVGLVISVVMVAGCSAPAADPVAGPAPEELVTSSGAAATDIVLVVNGEASLKEDYGAIHELAAAKSVVAIVRGSVAGTKDVYLDRFGYRILTVNVTEGLRGQTGQQVTVLEDGGVVPYATVLPDMPPKDGDPAPRLNPSGFVDFRLMGARHSETGDEVVLFLGKNPNAGTAIDTEYFIVSSVHGRFTLDTKTNEFVRALGGDEKDVRPGFVTSAAATTLSSEIAAAPR